MSEDLKDNNISTTEVSDLDISPIASTETTTKTTSFSFGPILQTIFYVPLILIIFALFVGIIASYEKMAFIFIFGVCIIILGLFIYYCGIDYILWSFLLWCIVTPIVVPFIIYSGNKNNTVIRLKRSFGIPQEISEETYQEK